MARTSKNDKKKWPQWQGRRDKDFIRTMLNILLQKEIGDYHEQSYRKDELYIINSAKFQKAIADARKSLGLVKGKRKGIYQADFDKAVNEALKTAELTDDWRSYMEKYIASNNPSGEPLFLHPGKIMVKEINEDNELLIRLKPGLRYEDYVKAWNVFSRPLGEGVRLNKSYSNEEEHLTWLQDKDRGMTYMQVAEKYFPSHPDENVERIKKAILRLRKRIERDK